MNSDELNQQLGAATGAIESIGKFYLVDCTKEEWPFVRKTILEYVSRRAQTGSERDIRLISHAVNEVERLDNELR